MSTSTLRHNLRHCTYDGIAATPIVYLLQPGNFIIAALLVEMFQLPPATYGLIASLPFWGNFAQAFLMPLVNRSYSPKAVSVASSSLQALCWAIMAVMLSFLPIDQPQISGRWFITLFAVSAAVTALTGVSWMSWVQEWVPVRLRGKYFGRRNRLLQVAQILFLVLSGWLIGELSGSIVAFQVVLGSAVVLRVASVLLQRKIHAEIPVNDRAETRIPWRDQVRALLETKPFLWLVSYGAAWGFAASTFGPFYAIFMYKQLGFSVQNVSTLVILSSVGGAVSAPAWGALADRFGNKPVMLFCMIAWQVQNLLWCVLTPENSWLLYGMWSYGGVMGAGFVLSLFNLQLKIIPPHAKTLAISANLAITSLITAMGPIVGGEILQHLLQGNSSPIEVYHQVFLVLPVMALLACLLLTRVHERASSPLSSVVGAMRNIRTLGGVFGLSILVDYVFIKPSPSAKKQKL
ncbi:MFS transporter [Rariglobus hedericola]|nr:MFS transporter [Rariglobus hedericola]